MQILMTASFKRFQLYIFTLFVLFQHCTSSSSNDLKHSHLIQVIDTNLIRHDILRLLKPTTTTNTATQSSKLSIRLLDTATNFLDGVNHNKIELDEKSGQKSVRCSHKSSHSNQICEEFEIELSADAKDSQEIKVVTTLNFNSFFTKTDRTYRSLLTPQHFKFNSPTLFYHSSDLDESLDHEIVLNVRFPSEQELDPNFELVDDSKFVATYKPDQLPKDFSFHYKSIDKLVQLEQIVKTVSLHSMNGYSKFHYSGYLKSIREPVTVPFTSYEMDKYVKDHIARHEKFENNYLIFFYINPQFGFEQFSASDTVGKNYQSHQTSNNILIFLRYPLVSDWKTDFLIKYFVNLKSMVSSNPDDGSKIIRINNGESDISGLTVADTVKTIIELPEGSTLKDVNAPSADKVVTEKIDGILQSFVRITVFHKRTLNAKIVVSYFDSNNIITILGMLLLKYVLPLVALVTIICKLDFSIENSQEMDEIKAQKKRFSKLCQKTKTYMNMLKNFEGILESYKVKKDIGILKQSFDLFRQNCSAYLEKELQPLIDACKFNNDLNPLILQIGEAHQQHIEALCDFHDGKIDRSAYINHRLVINDVIEQAERSVLLNINSR